MALSTFQSGEWDKSMVLIAMWTGKEDKANVVPVYKIMRSLCVCQLQPAAGLSLERLLQRPRSPRVDKNDYDYECDDYRQTLARQNDRDTVDTEPSRTEMPATTNEAVSMACRPPLALGV